MIFDVKTNKVTATIPGIGGTDMAEADVKLGLYYTASAGNAEGSGLGVIDAKAYMLIQKIPTAGRAHSVAVNPKNHHVYVPEAQTQGGCGCIRICSDATCARGAQARRTLPALLYRMRRNSSGPRRFARNGASVNGRT